MNQVMKWSLLFTALGLMIDSNRAWNIGAKSRVTGPVIHSTYFLTPNNAPFTVHASAYVGSYVNNICQYNAIYDLGTEMIRTGDFIYIDAFALKSVIGTAYNCMSIYYVYKQLVIETFQLNFDGFNYVNSYPATSEVTIL